MSDLETQNQCGICKINYPRRCDLYRHLRTKHEKKGTEDPVVLAKMNYKFSCPVCHHRFTRNANLKKHIRSKHPTESVELKQQRSRLVCPADDVCKECFRTYQLLRNHLSAVHNFSLVKETLTFDSESKFLKWKADYEKYNGRSYVMDTSPKRGNGCVRMYYSCHHSYSFRSKGKNLRKLKSAGTIKTGTACPSTINVIKMPNIINVEFWTTHSNCCPVGRVNLTKSERAQIAAKIRRGMSFQHILDEYRNSDTKEDASQRLRLLKRKDLHNIKRDFKISAVPEDGDQMTCFDDGNDDDIDFEYILIKTPASDGLENNELETDELENGELENDELENNELETDELENGELENDELENNELETDELENGKLETDELENGELESDELEQTSAVSPTIITKGKNIDNNLTSKVLQTVQNYFKRPDKDRCSIFGENIATRLRKLPKRQQLLAEKLINDVLFEAEMGSLEISHRIVNQQCIF